MLTGQTASMASIVAPVGVEGDDQPLRISGGEEPLDELEAVAAGSACVAPELPLEGCCDYTLLQQSLDSSSLAYLLLTG